MDFLLKSRCDEITEIYNAYVDDMYTYGLYLGFKEEDVIDATHDVFVNLCESKREIKEILNIKSFLFKSLRNRLIDIKRSSKSISFDNYTDTNTLFTDTQKTPEDKIINIEDSKEIELKINEMLMLLSPMQKEIIYLHFIQEQDYKHIAEIMDVNYNNCRKMVYKALSTLREKYGTLILSYLICQIYSTTG